jgi:hypothetical protein
MEQENDNNVPVPTFEMGKHHKNALKTLLFVYHNNRQTLTYPELSDRIGVGEKTKAWQCGAWRDLKSEGYIVPASEKGKFELSLQGVALATTLATPEELAEFQPPATNKELHVKIKAKLDRLPKGAVYAGKILDLMLQEDYIPLNRNDMAAKFNTLADSHGFFYGRQSLKKMKYVEYCTTTETEQIERFRATIMSSYVKEENSHVKEEDSGKDAVEDEKLSSSIKEEADHPVKQERSGENEAVVKEEKTSSSTGKKNGKRKAVSSTTTSGTSALEEENDSKSKDEQTENTSIKTDPGPKKKKYKSTKKPSGGQLLKLAATAYVTPPPCRWM